MLEVFKFMTQSIFGALDQCDSFNPDSNLQRKKCFSLLSIETQNEKSIFLCYNKNTLISGFSELWGNKQYEIR